jgi:hypothetical protein
MSAYANTPETYAAWRTLEANRGISIHEQFSAEYTKGREELTLLMAGTKCPGLGGHLLLLTVRVGQTSKGPRAWICS